MIKIDPEFHVLIPPLINGEYRLLEKSLLSEGCRDALVVWNNILLDGHNRKEICDRHNIKYDITEIRLGNRAEAADWIDKNQLGRRNLSPDQTAILRGRRYNRVKKSHGGDRKSSVQNAHLKTADRLAKEYSVSNDTIRRDGQVAAYLDNRPEDCQAVLSGEKKLTDVRREIKRESVQKKLNGGTTPLPAEKYDVILADPPWRYDFAETTNRAIENHYSTMDIDEIKALEIPAADNAVLFLWATAPKLVEAIQVLESWGFDYKTCAMWDKVNIGMGYWFRGRHELLLVGVKGKIKPPEPNVRFSSIITEKRTSHSSKPEVIYDMIEKMLPGRAYLELFARNERKNWEAWGNEC